MRRLLSALALFGCAGLVVPSVVVGVDTVSASRASAAGVTGEAVVQYAERFLGYPYTTVGNSPATGFSCIGFVSYVYQSLGINVPDDLGGAMAFAAPVAFADLQPGDVLFFQNTVWSGLSHTAIYIGGGRFVHAEWYNRGVVTSSFTNDPVDYNYWTEHYLGANRPWAVPASVTAATTTPAQPSSIVPNSVVPSSTASRAAIITPAKVVPQLPAGPRARVHVSALNVRTRPGMHAYISAVIVRGTRVVILGGFNQWYRIALPNGSTGWVVGAGIGRGGTLGAANFAPKVVPERRVVATVRRATSVARRTIAARVRTHGAVTVAVSGLRIHTGPSVTAGVIGSAGLDQRLALVNRWSGWVKVQLANGRVGWISGLYTTGGASVVTRSVRTASVATRRQVSTRVTAARSVSVTRIASGRSMRANQSATVNVRQSPSLAATILTILPPGGKYQVLGQSAGWVHARLASGVVGWVSSQVLRGSSAQTTSSTPSVPATDASSLPSVVTAGVRLRTAPRLTGATLRLVAAGTHVQVLETTSGWAKVRLPDKQTGYIFGSYVG